MLTAAWRSSPTKATLRSTLARPSITHRMSLMEPKTGARIRWCCLRLTWFRSRTWRLLRARLSTEQPGRGRGIRGRVPQALPSRSVTGTRSTRRMMPMTRSAQLTHRRTLLRAGAVGGLATALGSLALPVRVGAEEVLMTASGAGVNLKLMPDVDGNPVVPMREPFAFDANYAQCIVEDNAERFAMDTFGMGRVVIEPHQFFMAMHADNMGLYGITREANGALTATLLGALFCSTYAGTT